MQAIMKETGRAAEDLQDESSQGGVIALQAALHHVRVRSVEDGLYTVVCATGLYRLPAAAGCLLQPRAGDLVLISLSGGSGYVLNVLEQAEPDDATLQFQGNVRFSLPHGSLHVAAAGGLALDAGPALAIHSRLASIDVKDLCLSAGSMNVKGEIIQSAWTKRVEVSRVRQEITASNEAHVGNSVRRVLGHDEQSAGSTRLVVERDWRVRAERADLVAQRRVKVDADQVQLG